MKTEQTDTTSKHEFPCGECGAALEFKPGTVSLACPYCGQEQKIQDDESATIEEYSLEETLTGKKTVPLRALAENGKERRCRGCGAVTNRHRAVDSLPVLRFSGGSGGGK